MTGRPQIDAIGGARFDDGAGGDNEVQRTMLEIVNQLDGFDSRGNIKVPPPSPRGYMSTRAAPHLARLPVRASSQPAHWPGPARKSC